MGIGLFRSSEGLLCGYVPTGARVTFQATELLSSCDFEPVTFGPIMGQSGDSVDLGVINLEANQSEVSLITGTVVDCDGNAVAKSQVNLVTPFGKKSFYFEESDFEIQLNNCGGIDRVVIQTRDLSTLQTNQFLSKEIMPVISCGEVVACNELDCALEEDAFTGPYLLEVEDDVLSFLGPSYPSDVIVNLVEGSDGYGHRVFESIIFPDRFSEMQESVGPYLTSFYIRSALGTVQILCSTEKDSGYT